MLACRHRPQGDLGLADGLGAAQDANDHRDIALDRCRFLGWQRGDHAKPLPQAGLY